MSLLVLLFAFLSFPLIHSVYAAEELDIIEVKAEKEFRTFNLGSAQSISLENASLNSTSLLAPLLEESTGVISTQNGGPGGRVTFFVRGTEARHLAFTIDGLKINDPSNTDRQFDSAFLSSPFLKELSLYKGPQAVLFGSDALGGLVDMRSRKGEYPGETRFNLNGGSFGTADSSLGHDWRRGKNQGTFTISSVRTDGISRLNKKRFGAHERDGASSLQLTSSSGHEWSPRWNSDFLLSFLRGENELDGNTSDNDVDKSKNDQYLLQQKSTYSINKKSALSLRNGSSRHQRSIKTIVVGKDHYDGHLEQHELLHHWESRSLNLMSGLSSEREEFSQTQVEERAHLDSAFVQSGFKWQELKFQAGTRWDQHSLFGSFQTGSAGLGKEWGKHLLSFQYSQGFKAPSLYQLYGPAIFGFPVGNRKLQPESNHASELKWTYKGEDMVSEISLFQNRLSNLITFTNRGYENQGRFIAEGAEFSTDIRSSKMRFRPGVNYQNFRKETSIILRRPRMSSRMGVSYFPWEELELGADLKVFSSRKDLDPQGGIVKLNGFETVDLKLRYLQGVHEYGVQLKNLMGRVYEELYGYSVIPRSVFFHYGVKF